MTEALLNEAQRTMDLYYQDFVPDDAFFRLEDFAHWIGVVYDKDIDVVAKDIYKNSFAESGMGQLVFSQEFWASKEYVVKNSDDDGIFVDLDINYAGFTYDNQNSGIQLVSSNISCQIIRQNLLEMWQMKSIPVSNVVFWFLDDKKIKLVVKNVTKCIPKKIKIHYIPSSVDSKFKLPLSRRFDIATQAWNLMIAAKQSTSFLDETNDRNRNGSAQTESNVKQLQPNS